MLSLIPIDTEDSLIEEYDAFIMLAMEECIMIIILTCQMIINN